MFPFTILRVYFPVSEPSRGRHGCRHPVAGSAAWLPLLASAGCAGWLCRVSVPSPAMSLAGTAGRAGLCWRPLLSRPVICVWAGAPVECHALSRSVTPPDINTHTEAASEERSRPRVRPEPEKQTWGFWRLRDSDQRQGAKLKRKNPAKQPRLTSRPQKCDY